MSDYYPSSVSSGPTKICRPGPFSESGHRPKGQGRQGPAMASLGLTKALVDAQCFLTSARFDLYFLDVFKCPRSEKKHQEAGRRHDLTSNPPVSIGSILAVLTGPMSPLTVVTCHVSGHPKNRQQHHNDLGRIKCPNSGGYLRHPPCGLPILVPHLWRSRTCLKLDPWTIIT